MNEATAVRCLAGVGPDGAVDAKAVSRLDTAGKTVEQVFSALSSFVCKTELEPEWLCPANLMDDSDEAAFGARHSRLWPEPNARDRIAVSVCIGTSEGWIIHVDWVTRPVAVDSHSRHFAVMPLMRAKVFSSDQAWKLAQVIARKLDTA